MDINEILDSRLKAITEDESSGVEFNKRVIKAVINNIYKGHSAIKKPLQSGIVSISDIVRCIKNKRCLRGPDQDYGATYLEQILGTSIRQVIPLKHINHARHIFGLKKLPPSELIKHVDKQE